jgi:hypothetical protein
MQTTKPPTPLLPIGAIARRPGFREKIVSKAELGRIEDVLLRHDELYENAPPSPQAAQRAFFDGTIGPMPQSGSHRAGDFVRWARAIVEAAKLDPDHEWTLLAQVNANVQRELDLIREVISERIPDQLKEVVAGAEKSSADFRSLLGISERELFLRMAATIENINARCDEADKAQDKAAWLELLRDIAGIEV